MLRITMLMVVAALAATAQTPILRPIGECGFDDALHDRGRGKADRLADFAIPFGDLCDQYTYEAGWEETMQLQLGEGAEDYLPLIEQAVKAWNEIIYLPNWKPLIEISDEEPSNYRLPASFWNDRAGHSSRNMGDRENVIYFKPSREGDEAHNFWGMTRLRTRGGGVSREMDQADLYINTSDEETFLTEDGGRLALTKLLASHDDDRFGIYAFVDKTYLVILHELGHAVGLKHIAVTGNVMSREFMPGTVDQWAAPMSMYLLTRPMTFGFTSPWYIPFMSRHEVISPYMVVYPYPNYKMRHYLLDLFTRFATPGEQEKMALACIYEY